MNQSDFNTDDMRRRARCNYLAGAAFNAMAAAIRGGIDDDAELLRIAMAAEQRLLAIPRADLRR